MENEPKTGLKGQTLEQIIARFFGSLDRWPKEPVINPQGLRSIYVYTQDEVTRICQFISDTGHCLWHAEATVLDTKCFCAKCHPQAPAAR